MIHLERRSSYTPEPTNGPPPKLRESLSRQQVNVALLVADGFTDKQIAALLRISGNAVRIYIDRIRKKWGLRKDRNVRTEITRAVIDAWADYEDRLTKLYQDNGHEER